MHMGTTKGPTKEEIPVTMRSSQRLAVGLPSNQLACASQAITDDGWQARNLSTSSSRALRWSCRFGYSNVDAVYVRFWRDVLPMLLPEHSHLFWDRISKGQERLKTGTVRNALNCKMALETFWNARLAVR